jgi:hypothetical protein
MSHALGETMTTVCGDECCAPPALVLPPKPMGNREAIIREAFRLEWLTVGWMSVEGAVTGTELNRSQFLTSLFWITPRSRLATSGALPLGGRGACDGR